jgi:hypothetical protein
MSQTQVRHDPESTTSTPRWVKGVWDHRPRPGSSGRLMFTGIGDEHGPGRYVPSGAAGDHTPPIEHGVQ